MPKDKEQHPIEYMANLVVTGLVIMLFWTLWEMIYHRVAPHTWYFNYYDVIPEKSEYKVGEDICFLSDSEFKKDGEVLWNDILFCENEKGVFTRFSEFNSQNTYIEASERKPVDQLKAWKYRSQTPDYEVECYLISNITWSLPYGIDKKQRVVGQKFLITE